VYGAGSTISRTGAKFYVIYKVWIGHLLCFEHANLAILLLDEKHPYQRLEMASGKTIFECLIE
jgi:hypothetical protein